MRSPATSRHQAVFQEKASGTIAPRDVPARYARLIPVVLCVVAT